MPCNSDYMEPNTKEKQLQETAILYKFALERNGRHVTDKLEMDADDRYCTADYVADLCDLIRGFSDLQMDLIVYDGRNPTSRRLADWWERHEQADREREERERRERLGGKDFIYLTTHADGFTKRVTKYEALDPDNPKTGLKVGDDISPETGKILAKFAPVLTKELKFIFEKD